MAKEKKFRHKLARPSLAASLEAVRQGQALAVAPVQETVSEIHVTPKGPDFSEASFVGIEIRRILLLMGSLLLLLIGLTIAESRTQFLTNAAQQLLVQ